MHALQRCERCDVHVLAQARHPPLFGPAKTFVATLDRTLFSSYAIFQLGRFLRTRRTFFLGIFRGFFDAYLSIANAALRIATRYESRSKYATKTLAPTLKHTYARRT